MKVVVKMRGGLGNQLFQYAFGMYLKDYYKVQVFFDTGYYAESDSAHGLKALVPELRVDNRYNWLFAVLNKKKLYRFSNYLASWFYSLPLYINKLATEELWNLVQRNILFDGYWQHFPFPESLKTHIRWDRSDEHCTETYLNLKQELATTKVTAVHIRLGDYLVGKAAVKYAVCSSAYYKQAMHLLAGSTDEFWLFTNDVAKAEKEFATVANLRILPNLSAEESLRLMAQCANQIIANSTFSWWAAYAATNGDAKVVAPQKWFRDERFNLKLPYPKHWTILEN